MHARASEKRQAASPVEIPGAKKTPFPSFIEPCDPTLRERVPPSEDWLFEIKGGWLPRAASPASRAHHRLFPPRL
jgi:hypothetical protein